MTTPTNANHPPTKAVRPQRFDIQSEAAAFLEHLDTHGYAVVASVASPDEVEHAKDLFWQFLEGNDGRGKVSPNHARRGDPTTWEEGWLAYQDTGVIFKAGVGQAPFMWFLRLLPAVSQVYAAIWGTSTSDLLVSMDGANVFRPWQKKPQWKTKSGWFHVDQNAYNPGKQGRCSVQGLVTLMKADEHSGGLTVIPGSHHEFQAVCERNADKPLEEGLVVPDLVNVGADDEIRSKGAHLVCAEAGDLIIFDSRLVHCNSPALVEPTKDLDLIRMVAYINMTPASWASDDILQDRWEAYMNNVTASHWPHQVKDGTRAPYDMPKNDPRTLSERQCRLIGARMDPPEITKDDSVPLEYTKEQLEARQLLEQAEEAEGNGDCMGAIKLYKKAYQLDPSLEFPNHDDHHILMLA